MLLLHLHRRSRMGVAITLCPNTQKKRSDDKSDNAFLFRRENEFVSQFLPLPTVGNFQFVSCFTRGRTRTDG
jgi:hypothetical protein